MSTPVSMTAMTFPSPFWATWSMCIMRWALRLAGSCPPVCEDSMPPSASGVATSLTRPSRSRNAARTPGARRIASSAPTGALRAKPDMTLSYSCSTWAEAPGKRADTASLISLIAPSRDAPSSSWTMTPTTRAGSVSASVEEGADCPLFEVSAVSMSPTGREVAAPSCVPVGPGGRGEARVAGPVTASAHAPTKARRAAGFFVDISLLRYVGGRSADGTRYVGVPAVSSQLTSRDPRDNHGIAYRYVKHS